PGIFNMAAMAAILKIGFKPHEQIWVSSLIRTCIPSFSFIGLAVSEKKMFTHDARRTTHVARRSTDDGQVG
ncbi:hypothetical protein, partial [Escherichia coli]|uniref:hypothetical protein n=1 Tax=Escherichia coli TaxID=562 RepID=UPI0028DE01E0